MAAPIFTAFEARTRAAFLALMNALSLPGRPFSLITGSASDGEPQASTGRGLVVIGEALLDLETRFFTPIAALETELRATTALPEAIPAAEYLFYPQLAEGNLTTLSEASTGEMLFPDRAATLILGCHFSGNATEATVRRVELHLGGPGIQGVISLAVSGLPEGFWALRESRRRYPLGWDVFLVDGMQVIGIPRSTQIERIG